MSRAQKRLADGLLKAIQSENDGHHFYRMAAQTTQDPRGRETFLRLAEEELGHQEFLRAQYGAILSTGTPDRSLRLGQPADPSGAHPIFSDQLRKRLTEAHFEMTALSIGIQLELDAQQFYRKESKAATDSTVRRFFTELANWESGHYRALLHQQEVLKEDYWSAGGFAPF